MEKKRAIELLIQEVDKIPYLKTLPSSNDEFRLWLKNVENIINTGLEPEDKNKCQEASQFLRYLRGVHEEDLIQQDYIDEIIRYEIALKSIIQKYEILWMEGEKDKRGEVEMDKKEAIEFLEKSLEETSHLRRLRYDDEDFELWISKIKNVIKAGLDQDDYETFDSAYSISIPMKGIQTEKRWLEFYQANITRRETAIKKIIQKHEILGIEKKSAAKREQKDTVKLPIQLFDALQFHPKVVEASRKLFKDGHYRDAIYRAFVEVSNFVKRKAKSQLDGRKLMSTVFNPANPIIKLNPLETQTDKDEQEGFMYLFMGAIQGIRNPKAHENIIQNNPYIALKLIGFASLLIQTIDFWEAEKS